MSFLKKVKIAKLKQHRAWGIVHRVKVSMLYALCSLPYAMEQSDHYPPIKLIVLLHFLKILSFIKCFSGFFLTALKRISSSSLSLQPLRKAPFISISSSEKRHVLSFPSEVNLNRLHEPQKWSDIGLIKPISPPPKCAF